VLNVSPCADPTNREVLIDGLAEAINGERGTRQLPALRLDHTLTQISEFYACRLVDGGFFAHEDPFDGSTVDVRAANFGYAFLKIGENLASGQRSVAEAVAAWMASPAHRANILDPAYTEIGAAVKVGGDAGTYWVLEFGRPITANAEPAEKGTPALDDETTSSRPAAAQTGAAFQKND
jgi:uncharacterized protein YkwD